IVISKPIKQGEPYLLIKANRGERDTNYKAGLTVYKIQNPNNLKNVLNKLLKLKNNKKGQNYFLHEIDLDLDLKEIKRIIHKDQTIGNCVLASGKLNIRSAIYAELLQNQYSQEEAINISRNLYKSFTAFARTLQVKQFIEKIKELEKYCKDH